MQALQRFRGGVQVTSRQQQRILEIARSQGHIWLQQVHKVYESAKAAHDCLERLCHKKILKISERPGRFDYTGGRAKEVQVTL